MPSGVFGWAKKAAGLVIEPPAPPDHHQNGALTMAESTVNQSTKSTDLHKLHGVIEGMDALAQGGFSEISAIAKLALAALQTPEGYRNPENIVQALQAIRNKAVDIDNCINWAAEEVGCNYKDEQLHSRYDAQRSARETEQGTPQVLKASGPDLKLVH